METETLNQLRALTDCNRFARDLVAQIDGGKPASPRQEEVARAVIRENAQRLPAGPRIDAMPIIRAMRGIRALRIGPGQRFIYGRNGRDVLFQRDGEIRAVITADGKAKLTRNGEAQDRETVTSVATDPKAAAIRFGHATSNCAVCGRTLTDPESVNRGIGPICLERMT